MSMSWFVFMTMLIDFNVMNEREDKGKEKVIKGSGGGLAQFMR